MRLLRRIYFSELLRGSFFVLIAGNFASLGNFLYNLAMGRMLVPAAYGELEAVLSLSVLITVPLSILSVFIVKITSTYWGQDKRALVQSFLAIYRNKLFTVTLVGSLLLLVLSRFLGNFLNLSSILSVVFLGFFFLLSGITTVNNSGLQGTLSFKYLAVNGIVGAGVKLLVSVGLVFLNFQLVGALLGPTLGALVSFLLSAVELQRIFNGVPPSQEKVQPIALKSTFYPTLFSSLSLTIFLTLDVILARHFLSSSQSGEFAITAVLGKIVYYAVGPIISVMFPLISSRASNGRKYLPSLLGSLVLVFSISGLICFMLFRFPELILYALFGGKYLSVASYLGPYAFFMVLFSINSILTYFLLAVSYFRLIWLLFAISLLQGVLITLFHSSINQLIWVNITVSFLYFVVVSVLVCHFINFPSSFLPIVRQKPLSEMSKG